MRPTDSVGWVEDASKQIGKLLSGELIAFEVGDEFPIPADNRGMQGMDEHSFVRDIVHSEEITDTLNITDCASEKTPVIRVSLPCVCIITQCFRPVMDWVESNCKQYEIFSQPPLKLFLNYAKVVRRSNAIFRQRAPGINEIKSNDFAGELAKVQGAPLLIRESKIWHRLSNSQPAGPAQSLFQRLQAAGFGGFSFGAVVPPHADVFGVRVFFANDQNEFDKSPSIQRFECLGIGNRKGHCHGIHEPRNFAAGNHHALMDAIDAQN